MTVHFLAEKTKRMTQNFNGIHKEIKVSGQKPNTFQLHSSHHIGPRIKSRNGVNIWGTSAVTSFGRRFQCDNGNDVTVIARHFRPL